MSEWISVDDEHKPPFLKDVLISMGGDIDVAYYHNGMWFCYGEECEFHAVSEVTHWMELPLPPNPTEED